MQWLDMEVFGPHRFSLSVCGCVSVCVCVCTKSHAMRSSYEFPLFLFNFWSTLFDMSNLFVFEHLLTFLQSSCHIFHKRHPLLHSNVLILATRKPKHLLIVSHTLTTYSESVHFISHSFICVQLSSKFNKSNWFCKSQIHTHTNRGCEMEGWDGMAGIKA